jgi:hypothetical protein
MLSLEVNLMSNVLQRLKGFECAGISISAICFSSMLGTQKSL